MICSLKRQKHFTPHSVDCISEIADLLQNEVGVETVHSPMYIEDSRDTWRLKPAKKTLWPHGSWYKCFFVQMCNDHCIRGDRPICQILNDVHAEVVLIQHNLGTQHTATSRFKHNYCISLHKQFRNMCCYAKYNLKFGRQAE